MWIFRLSALFFLVLVSVCLQAQEDTLRREKTLDEVIISVNKWEEKKREIPNKIIRVNKSDILTYNPQTSADLLGQTGRIFIQKSQLGGGSPMIRGFATNRVLLVIDGVRMNNAIYRSGNLQNVISIDALSTESVEVIFGPGSIVYGSDAIGGVMDFQSLRAGLQTGEKPLVKGSALSRYSSANNERSVHADVNVGGRKWSHLSSFSHSSFDDLRMGKHGGHANYLRPEYVERTSNVDSIFKNKHTGVQRFSGYNQLNLLQKIRFKPSERLDIQYSYTLAKTGEAPRYDRLIQYRQGRLRFAEWNYGPMIWRMHSLQVLHSPGNGLYDDARFTISYQEYEESRIDRTRGSNSRNTQQENVKATSINWDATKGIGKGKLFYGIEYVYNNVGSKGSKTDISNGIVTAAVSRYPDNSDWSTSGVYASYNINIVPKVTLRTGLRYNHNTLHAKFDTTYIKFPYRQTDLKDGAFTGNVGVVFRPGQSWQVNGNFSTGYRMPNVDDIGKLFESVPGNVTVPNPSLTPEYAWNFEAGIVKSFGEKSSFELNGFHTILDNAIVRRPFTFNGRDSIVFGGANSRVEALQNVAKATVWGMQASAEIYLGRTFRLQTHANWITGRETDDSKNEQVPLRHAPPFYGSTLLKYNFRKLYLEASAIYNTEVRNKDLAPSEKSKTEIYAVDANGLPYSPAWYTLNLRASYGFNQHLLLTLGLENITDQRYRPYSSGIVAPGRNFIVSVRASL